MFSAALPMPVTTLIHTEPAVLIWVADNAENNPFAASLAEYVERTNCLTGPQVEAVKRKVSASESAAEVDVSAIEKIFAIARANKVETPRMRLDEYLFKLSKKGPIYVTAAGEYMGKIDGGKFYPSPDCDDATKRRILAAASAPHDAAKAYGQRTHSCSICGLKLTNAASIERLMGDICAEKYGF